MSRNKKIIITLTFMMSGFIVLPICGQGFLINQVKTLEIRNLDNKKYSDIVGSPYYSNDFINSTIYLKNGNYSNQPLRYDMFRDEMEFMKDGTILWLIKNDIKYIRYGTDMIILASADGDTTKTGYYFLRENGKYILFSKKSVIYEPMVPPKGYSDIISERFTRDNDDIFIKYQNMPARKIRNKKDLKGYFSDNKTALDFIKKEKIKADRIEDLNKLVSMLNKQ